MKRLFKKIFYTIFLTALYSNSYAIIPLNTQSLPQHRDKALHKSHVCQILVGPKHEDYNTNHSLRMHTGTGFFVTKKHILTAAHVIHDLVSRPTQGKKIKTNCITIALEKATSEGHSYLTLHKAKSFLIHSKYESSEQVERQSFDVGIIELDNPIESIKPVALFKHKSKGPSWKKKLTAFSGKVIGFGQNIENEQSRSFNLRYSGSIPLATLTENNQQTFPAGLIVAPHISRSKKVTKNLQGFVTKNMYKCLNKLRPKLKNKKRLYCQVASGDSGAPIYYKNSVVGITSGTREIGSFSPYTRATTYGSFDVFYSIIDPKTGKIKKDLQKMMRKMRCKLKR